MGVIYAVVNQKGGVGKTTTAVNVGAYLALAGQKVLLIDLDPQGNATSGLGIDKNAIGHSSSGLQYSVYDLLINEVSIEDTVIPTEICNLWVAPSNLDLAGAELELMPRMSRETCLKRLLDPVRNQYDYIVIDSPPSLGLLTLNGLAAADAAIVPIQCEYYALEGVSQLMRTVDLVKRHLNPSLEIGLVILTMYDNRIKLSQQVVDEVREAFGDRVARTIVPRNVRLSEAPSHGKPVALYDARSRGAKAYREIAEEIMKHGKAGIG